MSGLSSPISPSLPLGGDQTPQGEYTYTPLPKLSIEAKLAISRRDFKHPSLTMSVISYEKRLKILAAQKKLKERDAAKMKTKVALDKDIKILTEKKSPALMVWPPNYTAILKKRQLDFLKIEYSSKLIHGAKEYYKTNPICFIQDWCVTYDPRNASRGRPTTMPFILFPRQKDFVTYLMSLIEDEENGLVEKSRDMGVTWLACAFSVWLWLFIDGSSVGFGSRKESLVDKLGDPDSIFEKIRIIIDHLPRFLWPADFDSKKHSLYMRLINPENGCTITGEGGDNIGRGGRKSIYFKDESAHYERPQSIEAALADNTNVQVDISSVHGTANVFARRRQAGEIWAKNKEKIKSGCVRVFIFDWRDHPEKDQAWYDKREKKARDEGLLHLFAQEVDRDYSGAVEGVVIPNIWVMAAIDAHKKLGFDDEGIKMSALDVADEGGDKNSYTMRKGVVVKVAKSWGEGDTGFTTRKVVGLMRMDGVKACQYDSIGVGAGVKSESNRLADKAIEFVAWNAAASPIYKNQRIIKGDKQAPRWKDFVANLKAQAWWMLRARFEKTYKAITNGEVYDSSELISISSNIPELYLLTQELSQATYKTDGKGRILINKKPNGAKSPNSADSLVMNFWPLKALQVHI